MGLASSQARLLNLTARMHDIEYKAQNLEAQKLQMANESRQVYQEYEDALNKQKLQLKQIGPDGSANYVNATGNNLKEAGYAFQVIFGEKSGTVYNTITAAATAAGTSLSTEGQKNGGSTEAVTNLIQAGFIVLVKMDGQTFTDGEKLSTLIENNPTKNIYATNVATDTSLQEVSDELDLKKAEAKYEADMRKINAKDKKFDTDLAAMEQERNAIKTEIDTLKTVAKDNVDRTFKLFS